MSGLTRRFAAGAGWLFGFRWTERLLELASVVVLARLLTPDDFGVVAIAAATSAIVEGLAAFDVAQALIRSRDRDRELFDTAWTLSTLRGVLAAAVLLAIGLWLDDTRLGVVVATLAASPLLTGLANPRFVLFERELRYSRLAVLTVGAKLVSLGATVALAVVYRSYWALVAGILIGALASMVLSYALRPFSPRPSLARFRELFAFSGWLSLTTLVTTLAMETDKLIVGRWLGVTDAGRYFMTQRIGVLPTRELVSPLRRILFPSFSELAADRERLRRVVAESINAVASLSVPAGFGFALVAGDFVPLALGEKWREIVPLLTVLTPYLGLRATLALALPCAMALDRVRLLFGVSAAFAAVHLPVFVFATVAFGLRGSIWSLVVTGALYWWLSAWILRRCLGLTLGEIAVRLRRPVAAAVAMVGAVLALAPALPADLFAGGSWAALAVKVAVGAAVYAGVLYALWRLEGRPPGFERRLLQLRSR